MRVALSVGSGGRRALRGLEVRKAVGDGKPRAFAVLRKESSLQEILAGLSSLAFWRSAKLMETGMAVPWSGALLSSESGNGESKKTASHVLVPLPVDLHVT